MRYTLVVFSTLLLASCSSGNPLGLGSVATTFSSQLSTLYEEENASGNRDEVVQIYLDRCALEDGKTYCDFFVKNAGVKNDILSFRPSRIGIKVDSKACFENGIVKKFEPASNDADSVKLNSSQTLKVKYVYNCSIQYDIKKHYNYVENPYVGIIFDSIQYNILAQRNYYIKQM